MIPYHLGGLLRQHMHDVHRQAADGARVRASRRAAEDALAASEVVAACEEPASAVSSPAVGPRAVLIVVHSVPRSGADRPGPTIGPPSLPPSWPEAS